MQRNRSVDQQKFVLRLKLLTERDM